MLRQVGALREILRASSHRAGEGLFFGMDPQVVEEIAPLPELFAAAFVLALHNSSHSLSHRVLVPQNLIKSSIGNIFALANAVEGLRLFHTILFRYKISQPSGLTILTVGLMNLLEILSCRAAVKRGFVGRIIANHLIIRGTNRKLAVPYEIVR